MLEGRSDFLVDQASAGPRARHRAFLPEGGAGRLVLLVDINR